MNNKLQHSDLLELLAKDPDLKHVPEIAARFAERMGIECGLRSLRTVDERNEAEPREGVCHSHDVCDANIFMAEALHEVHGRKNGAQSADDLALQPSKDLTLDNKLWTSAWAYAKLAGFERLARRKLQPQ
jgi:hypothetical protein